ncbi:hypothetical protein LX36DRAFT_470923 [Colletotrichum falcatum]|nr:hypothetical protein LX36DRAFT_470923 [Colletotrichum falcatum]
MYGYAAYGPTVMVVGGVALSFPVFPQGETMPFTMGRCLNAMDFCYSSCYSWSHCFSNFLLVSEEPNRHRPTHRWMDAHHNDIAALSPSCALELKSVILRRRWDGK